MEKQFFIDRSESILRADSACAELKEAAKKWLDSIGTAGEAEAARQYLAELEEDVTPLEKLISFLDSDMGKHVFGEPKAKMMLRKAHDAEDMGMEWCICAACNAGGAILDNKDKFLELTKV